VHGRGCTRGGREREGVSEGGEGPQGQEREGQGTKMHRRGCARKGKGETGHEVRGVTLRASSNIIQFSRLFCEI
jgi:hypothetical protein